MSGQDLAWLDGALVEAGAARLSLHDRGFLLGDGAFETMRFEDGAIRRRNRHQARLAGALNWLEIAAPDFGAVEAGAEALTNRLGLERAVLRLTVSRGAYGGGLDAPSGGAGTVLLTARPLPEPPGALRLARVETARRAGLASERYKLTQYAEPLAARRAARRAGADWGLMVSAVDGSVVCADCANLFAVVDGALVTPPVSAGALPGTARAALLEAAAGRVEIREQPISPAALARAEAVAVSNAVIGVGAAVGLDGRALDPDHALVRALAELERGAA